MYMRAVTYRIVYLGIVSVGILLGAAFREQSTVQAAPIAAASRPSSTPALPYIVTLPTVSVRSATRASAVKAPGVSKTVVVQSHEAPADATHAATPSLRFDMPYYSFGKALPRVGKE